MLAALNPKPVSASPKIDPPADVVDRGRNDAADHAAPQKAEQDRPVGANDGVETIEMTRVSDHHTLLAEPTAADLFRFPTISTALRSPHTTNSQNPMCYRNDHGAIAALAGLICIRAGLVSRPCRQVFGNCSRASKLRGPPGTYRGNRPMHRRAGRRQSNRITLCFRERFPRGTLLVLTSADSRARAPAGVLATFLYLNWACGPNVPNGIARTA